MGLTHLDFILSSRIFKNNSPEPTTGHFKYLLVAATLLAAKKALLMPGSRCWCRNGIFFSKANLKMHCRMSPESEIKTFRSILDLCWRRPYPLHLCSTDSTSGFLVSRSTISAG